MVNNLKRRWQLAKVRSGDGSALRDYRFWQVFSRSLFFLELASPEGGHSYAVDVKHLAEPRSRKEHEGGVGTPPAALYRDGVQIARSNLPTAFPVPGGVIEVAISAFGLKRMHFVPELGGERALRPHPRSQEGLRARFGDRFPRTSAVIGTVAWVILLAALVVNALHAVEVVTHSPAIAERVGTFVSPIHLPTWANVTLIVAALLSGVDRALRLQHNRFIDVVSS